MRGERSSPPITESTREKWAIRSRTLDYSASLVCWVAKGGRLRMFRLLVNVLSQELAFN